MYPLIKLSNLSGNDALAGNEFIDCDEIFKFVISNVIDSSICEFDIILFCICGGIFDSKSLSIVLNGSKIPSSKIWSRLIILLWLLSSWENSSIAVSSRV